MDSKNEFFGRFSASGQAAAILRLNDKGSPTLETAAYLVSGEGFAIDASVIKEAER